MKEILGHTANFCIPRWVRGAQTTSSPNAGCWGFFGWRGLFPFCRPFISIIKVSWWKTSYTLTQDTSYVCKLEIINHILPQERRQGSCLCTWFHSTLEWSTQIAACTQEYKESWKIKNSCEAIKALNDKKIFLVFLRVFGFTKRK